MISGLGCDGGALLLDHSGAVALGHQVADSRCPLFHVFTPDLALCFYYKPVTMNWQVNRRFYGHHF